MMRLVKKRKALEILKKYVQADFMELNSFSPVVRKYGHFEGEFYSSFSKIPSWEDYEKTYDFVHGLEWRCSYGSAKTAKGEQVKGSF